MLKKLMSVALLTMLAGIWNIAYAEQSVEATCAEMAAEDQIPADERADFIAECVEDLKKSVGSND